MPTTTTSTTDPKQTSPTTPPDKIIGDTGEHDPVKPTDDKKNGDKSLTN